MMSSLPHSKRETVEHLRCEIESLRCELQRALETSVYCRMTDQQAREHDAKRHRLTTLARELDALLAS
jgi:hypothetical protein